MYRDYRCWRWPDVLFHLISPYFWIGPSVLIKNLGKGKRMGQKHGKISVEPKFTKFVYKRSQSNDWSTMRLDSFPGDGGTQTEVQRNTGTRLNPRNEFRACV